MRYPTMHHWGFLPAGQKSLVIVSLPRPWVIGTGLGEDFAHAGVRRIIQIGEKKRRPTYQEGGDSGRIL
jgi:hypothetical protein